MVYSLLVSDQEELDNGPTGDGVTLATGKTGKPGAVTPISYKTEQKRTEITRIDNITQTQTKDNKQIRIFLTFALFVYFDV